MGIYNEENDIQYCTRCGAVNKKSAFLCKECNKKIKARHLVFTDFLQKHLKSDIKNTASTSLFFLIRKFLIAHLYGTILTLSLVATVAVSAFNATPYIKNVSTQIATPNNVQEEPIEPVVHTVTDDDFYSVLYLTTNYDSFADYKRNGEPYYDQEQYVSSVSDLLAKGNIPDYNYDGVFQMYNNPISMPDDVFSIRRPIPSTATGNVTTELGKKLQAEGYSVMECDYYMAEFDHTFESDFDNIALWYSNNPTKLLVYRFVMVKTDDTDWYIAEERLVKSIG